MRVGGDLRASFYAMERWKLEVCSEAQQPAALTAAILRHHPPVIVEHTGLVPTGVAALAALCHTNLHRLTAPAACFWEAQPIT
jgi:hypothetical protein